MNKPIEPGCLAIIMSGGWFPDYPSAQVDVLEFCPRGSAHTLNGDPFEMDRDCWGVMVLNDGCVIDVDEKHLMRIDGGEDESIKEHQDEEVEV